MSYFTSAHRVLALAHRGFDRTGKENSMLAFAAARGLGLDHVETDAHATVDGVAVALHDERLDRTTDAAGAVADLPWDVVSRARIGGTEPVPRLDDLLGTWPDLYINIDIKADRAVAPVTDAIERTKSHNRVLVTSFSAQRRRRAVERLSRAVATSAGQSEIVAFLAATLLPDRAAIPAARAALHGVDCLQVPERQGIQIVSARTVAVAHRIGRPVHVWTVDDPAEMHRLLDLGVDGLVTNRADLIRDVLLARNTW